MNFLAEIVARKQEDSLRLFEPGVAEAFKAEIARRPAPVSLKAALDNAAGPMVIAEVKRASPSKGEFAMHWDPVALAQIYQDNGAAAISVLTEPHYFKGDPELIRRMRPVIRLPILRKDFIVEPIQIYETAAMCSRPAADCQPAGIGTAPGPAAPTHLPELEALVEVHTAAETASTPGRKPHAHQRLPANLHTFEMFSDRAMELAPPGAGGRDPGGRLGDQDSG